MQVLQRTPPSQRDRSAVDTLRALAKGRIWFWQTLPSFIEAFPDLPCWNWPIFRCESTTNNGWLLCEYRSVMFCDVSCVRMLRTMRRLQCRVLGAQPTAELQLYDMPPQQNGWVGRGVVLRLERHYVLSIVCRAVLQAVV